ncbi:MAG: hypothetical protein NTV29_09405 [Planctomycetota bacterium]|nr:hypothetical protein [Planctomycetota bacterium]
MSGNSAPIALVASTAWNADAATIQTALEALPSIGAGNVLVEVTASAAPSTFGRTITLNFRNGKGGQNLQQTTISITSLVQTPINPRPSTFSSTLVNGATVSEEQQLVLRGASGGTWRVAYNGEVTAPLSPTITSFDLQNVLNNFLGIDNVVVASSSLGGLTTDRVYNITFGGTQTGINMQTFFGDAANISNQSVRSITTTYNAAGELLSVNDPSSDVSFVRDNLGRATTVSSTVNGVGFSMGQSFDIVGNRTELRASGSGTPDFRNIYRYDKLNRLTEVIQTNQVGGNQVLPKRVTMAYNALGQRTQIARFQSTGTANPVATTDFTYDTANRLSGMAHKQGATNLNTYAYTYDLLSRLASVESTLDGLTSYIWDHRNRLTQVTERTQTNTRISEINYEYDAFNRLVRRYDALAATFTPVTYWVYDEGTNPLLEYFGGNPLIQHRYVWSDKVDDLLADEQNPGLSSRNTLWALSDHLGLMAIARGLRVSQRAPAVGRFNSARQDAAYGP